MQTCGLRFLHDSSDRVLRRRTAVARRHTRKGGEEEGEEEDGTMLEMEGHQSGRFPLMCRAPLGQNCTYVHV